MPLLRKTPAGQAEVTAKAHTLPPRARSLLIMIDGKRSMSDLRAMLGPQVDEAAELLQREGLVEVVDKAVTAPAPLDAAKAAVDDDAPAPPVPPEPLDWKEQRADSARALTQILGPMGDDTALRLERCKSDDELRAALRRAADLLDIAARPEQAAAFRRRFGV